MTNEKIFSTATTFEEIEARRYDKLKKSPGNMFNPKTHEAKPLEAGYGRTKKSLGL